MTLKVLEWNTADGPLKRKLAYDLAPFKQRFAHGGFIHFGQGKWYPGELFLAGICIILEKRRFAIMENDALVAKEVK
jgi:uncharacterized protein (DUF2126 family)